MANNKDLNKANKNKKDEFYTQLTDIEKELKHYKIHFKDAIVFCNCDDPEYSNFWKYFYLNFEQLGLKKLIATHYETEKPSYKLAYDGTEIINTPLEQNGDFRSPECIEILKECDIVCTNPPFSLFREYIAQLVKYEKLFIIIGNINAITYKNFFPLLKENKVWIGASIHSGDREFRVPNDYPLSASGFRQDEEGNKYISVKGVRWYTNLDYKGRCEDIPLFKKYNPTDYPKYVNYDAIEVSKVANIPEDYEGEIGVPITFMDKYNPEQFELLGTSRELVRELSEDVKKNGAYPQIGRFYLDIGKDKYKKVYERLIIKKRR